MSYTLSTHFSARSTSTPLVPWLLPTQKNTDTVFELLDPGIYVGLRTPENALETFYIAEVIQKGVAENNMNDDCGHYICAGEKYAEVCYLQKKSEGKRRVSYERIKSMTSVHIIIAEIFVTNIDLAADLKMTKEEYESIMLAAL